MSALSPILNYFYFKNPPQMKKIQDVCPSDIIKALGGVEAVEDFELFPDTPYSPQHVLNCPILTKNEHGEVVPREVIFGASLDQFTVKEPVIKKGFDKNEFPFFELRIPGSFYVFMIFPNSFINTSGLKELDNWKVGYNDPLDGASATAITNDHLEVIEKILKREKVELPKNFPF